MLNWILFWVFVRENLDTVPTAEIEHGIENDQMILLAGGRRAVHMPGHCAGQLAFPWTRHGGVVFAADAAANAMGLRLSITNENLDQGKKSLQKRPEQIFEVAVFGHGDPIESGAAHRSVMHLRRRRADGCYSFPFATFPSHGVVHQS